MTIIETVIESYGCARPDGRARIETIWYGNQRNCTIKLRPAGSWHRHVTVLGGPELRAAVIEEIRAMSAHYADQKKPAGQ